MVTVAKFGGAAMNDVDSIRRIAGIVAHSDRHRVLVASAMAGTTDALVQLLHSPGDRELQAATLQQIATRHREAMAGLSDTSLQPELDERLAGLEALIATIGSGDDVTHRLRDEVITYGERLAILLLAGALREAGVPAVPLEALAAGIRTDGPFGNARPAADAMDSISRALTPILDAGQVPVVTGFYGVDAAGEATIFGRGGSDYVAALLAAGLGADEVELWKDVAGFFTADPKAVPDARMVAELDYGEAAELAYFGAKILHPRAVEPIQQLSIPIRVRTFSDPSLAGTVIHAGAPKPEDGVRSAASREGLAVVRLGGPGMGHTPGIGERVFRALAEQQINVLNMANSQATFALLINDFDAPAAEAALRPVLGGSIQTLDVLRNRSLVCVVGRGLGEKPGSAARILDAVSRQNVNIEMISLGASEIAIDFIVPSADRARALQGLHDTFLRGDA